MGGAKEQPDRPYAIGRFFNTDGSACRFAGNGILCPVTTGNPGFAAIASIQRALHDDVFAKCFAFPPPSSLHVMLLDGVHEREPATWPAMAAGRTLRELTAELAKHLQALDAPIRFRMRPRDVWLDETSGSVIRLLPADATEQRKLANFRAKLADILGLPVGAKPEPFHLILSYLIDWPGRTEAAAIERAHAALSAHLGRALSILELGRAEFCSFENMLYFERHAYLGANSR